MRRARCSSHRIGRCRRRRAAALRAAGIAIDAELPAGARAVRCWAEAIALDRVPVAQIPALVLVTTPDAAGVVELAAELLRLGCERQELLAGPAGGVVRVTDPPTYTMMRALDREAGLRAYAPDPPGQDAVFTELGYRHPLAGRLAAEPGHLLLVAPDGWRSIPDHGWRGLETRARARRSRRTAWSSRACRSPSGGGSSCGSRPGAATRRACG